MQIKEDVFRIVRMLTDFPSYYQHAFGLIGITEDNSFPAIAAVIYYPNAQRHSLTINGKMWNQLDDPTKKFIVLHELGHILNMHLSSEVAKLFKENRKKANYATDVQVNHQIVDGMGFDRNSIKDWNRYCWIDTLSWKWPVSPGQTANYYYHSLSDGDQSQESFDDHDGFGSMSEEDSEKFIKDLIQDMSKDEVEQMLKNLGLKPGDQKYNNIMKLVTEKEISERWSKVGFLANLPEPSIERTWTRPEIRYQAISPDILLPGEGNQEVEIREELLIFLDVSGSCTPLIPFFVKAANSFDPKKYKIRRLAFDTEVHVINDDNYPTGGGTAFNIIEEYCASLSKYPREVWVFTDGEGNQINPKFKDRWKWFLGGTKSKQYTSDMPAYDLETLESL